MSVTCHLTEMHLGQSFDDLKTMNATYASTAIYFERGRYVEQLQAFTNIFRRDQLMVLSSVDTFKNSAVIVERVRKFLDAPPHKSLLRSMPHGMYRKICSVENFAQLSDLTHIPFICFSL